MNKFIVGGFESCLAKTGARTVECLPVIAFIFHILAVCHLVRPVTRISSLRHSLTSSYAHLGHVQCCARLNFVGCAHDGLVFPRC